MNPVVIVILAAVAALIAFRFITSYRSPEIVRQMRQLVDDGAVLLDVRTPSEFGAGSLQGARNIPLHSLGSRMDEIAGKETRQERRAKRKVRVKSQSTSEATKPGVVVYCASGSRSRAAARMLKESGYDPVRDLGPMNNWHKG